MLLTILCYLWLTWSVICVYLFHVAWWGTEKARRAEREIKGQWPLFEHPNLLKWNYWTMLLQSFTTMPFRAATMILSYAISGTVHGCLGRVEEKNTIKRKLSSYALWIAGIMQLTSMGFRLEENDVECDYSKWLGPNWRRDLEKFKQENNVATIVPNHTGGLFDIFTLMWSEKGNISFVAASFLSKVPVIGRSISAGDGIYVNREASASDRNSQVDTIAERQIGITSRQLTRKPLCIFAEGFSTIGGISKFKRGAFNSLMPVSPIVLQQEADPVYVGCYSSSQHCTIIASLCTLGTGTMKVNRLPPFVPNDYLFNTYNKRPDAPKWEVFADAVREAMIENSDLVASDMTYTKSREYMKLFQGDLKKSWTTMDKKDK